ncbi:chaperone modulator CbpM [Methylopila sp. M107]|uniref:chaperone modulator CbpM n=1 Tax=Methylopila sp. M107 TaxID=1101190 RepID=UPI00036E066D|nr:chaperone modulator CbpM [Methylopila sp. M107]
MIRIETLVARYPALARGDVERWIELEWVRADRDAETYLFREIDVARVELILRLRDDMDVNEDALPVVLSLLDQLFDARRRLRDVDDALAKVAPEAVRRDLAAHLTRRG